jgi:AraC family transcriptional regulator of adaptative response/methylated-DNA-[protein]-cysteine methyltransferase
MPADRIVYRELPSPLGKLLAGATAEGCCLLGFQDREDLAKTEGRLQIWHKPALRRGTNAFLDRLELELAEYFKGSLRAFSAPLDLKGTPFQMAVWRLLLDIPYGETRSYGQLARAVGKPGASRAVGRANGSNPVAIVVPCHRIICSDGQLGGYGGGLWRKKYLLALENGGKSS